MSIKFSELTLFEKKVYHFALWRWCAVHKRSKRDWPGWRLFDPILSKCFLCKGDLSVLCVTLESGSVCSYNCLKGLFGKYRKSSTRLKHQPDNVSYQKNFERICREIASVKFKTQSEWFVRTESNLQTISDIKLRLAMAYARGDYPERLKEAIRERLKYTPHDADLLLDKIESTFNTDEFRKIHIIDREEAR